MPASALWRTNEFFTYELAYPESLGGTVFYVGKGVRDRIQHHFREARRGIRSPKCDAIRYIWSRGEEVVARKICENMMEDEALAPEKELIQQYGIQNLTNKVKHYTEADRRLRSIATKNHWERRRAAGYISYKEKERA